MKRILTVLLNVFLIVGCKNEVNKEQESKQEDIVVFNQELADKLATRANIDQTAAGIYPEKYKKLGLEKWKSYKDSVFRDNKKFLEKVLKEHGFPGIDLVGKEGTYDFWLMVQHCDFDPAFQKEVLHQMKIEVDKGNAIPRNYGLLVDRVNLNTGKKQIYGTQVTYNRHTGQAYPKPLKDSVNVNKRRKAVELEPLEDYLNHMTINYFEMNKENVLKRGITEPKLYKTK